MYSTYLCLRGAYVHTNHHTLRYTGAVVAALTEALVKSPARKDVHGLSRLGNGGRGGRIPDLGWEGLPSWKELEMGWGGVVECWCARNGERREVWMASLWRGGGV